MDSLNFVRSGNLHFQRCYQESEKTIHRMGKAFANGVILNELHLENIQDHYHATTKI